MCSSTKLSLSSSFHRVRHLTFGLLLLLLLFSCAKTPDNAPTTGMIAGKVTDNTSSTVALSGVQIATIPATTSVLTNSNGEYTISNVDPGQYTVTATKSGYLSNNAIVQVIAGQTTNADIALAENPPVLQVTPSPLDFGMQTDTLELTLASQNGVTINWSAVDDRNWLGITPTSGTITGQTAHVTVVVNRDSMAAGNYTGSITFTSNGGNPVVQVLLAVPNPLIPQLSVNIQTIAFDTLSTAQLFTITNTGTGVLNWSITSNRTWILVVPVSGSTGSGVSRSISVSVDRAGLSNGNYSGALSIISNGGNIDIPVSMIVLPARPDAPTFLHTQLTTIRSAQISWNDNSSVEEGFRLERRTLSSPTFQPAATLPANTTTFADTGLAPHMKYYYRVQAFNQTMYSDYSNIDSVTTPNSSPYQPSTPIPEDLATNQACNLTLQWDGGDIDNDTLQYTLYFGTENPPPTLNVLSTNTRSLTGLFASRQYFWKVVARDNYGGIATSPVWQFQTAAPSGVYWSRTYHLAQFQEGRSIFQTAERGYICTGYTGTPPYGYDLWLTKLSETGSTVWQRILGGQGLDRGSQAIQCWGGGYAVVGSTASYGHGGSDVWLVRYDENGDTLWTKTYGGTGEDNGWSIIQSRSSGFVMVGRTYSYGNDAQIYVIKTDLSGNQQWARTFGGANYDVGFSIFETSDGGFAIGGTKYDAMGAGAFLLMKLNSSGNWQWERVYGTPNVGYCYSLKQTTDNDFIMTGEGYNSAGLKKLWIIRTDAQGNQRWLRQYGGNSPDYGNGIVQTVDGGIVTTGTTESSGNGGQDLWIFKTDANGDSLWSRSYGTITNDRGIGITKTLDNGIAIIGTSGTNDIWVLKTDVNGNYVP
ncbi:MAG: carboxypeptidase regulatory-like domain-containing protein [bacterium]|nr:carboxypeptidase regulatory-like domain-containing protein [bacterium]